MVLGSRSKGYSGFKMDKLRLFILSLLSPIIILYKKLCKKCAIKLLEFKYKILKIKKESISGEVKANIEKNISDLYNKYELYNTRKETYLTYHERKNLIDICKSCLNTCSFFRNTSKLLDESSNDFIEKSMTELSYLLSEFERYDNEGFIQERIQKYDYLFKKSPFPLDDSQKRAIVTDGTHNLVVAGAGSGKTEVLITRAAYLTEREPDKVDAKKILILAY